MKEDQERNKERQEDRQKTERQERKDEKRLKVKDERTTQERGRKSEMVRKSLGRGGKERDWEGKARRRGTSRVTEGFGHRSKGRVERKGKRNKV